jgi:hypothetical protein
MLLWRLSSGGRLDHDQFFFFAFLALMDEETLDINFLG